MTVRALNLSVSFYQYRFHYLYQLCASARSSAHSCTLHDWTLEVGRWLSICRHTPQDHAARYIAAGAHPAAACNSVNNI